MTHPDLTELSIAEIHHRGRDARRMGLPYFNSNPFAADTSLPLDECVAKSLAWYGGWIDEQGAKMPAEVEGQLLRDSPWLKCKL